MTKTNKKKAIKLIALDMDGTLLNKQGEVSEENRKAIKEAHEQGIQVVLSTGRSRATSEEYAKSLLLNSYLVNVNGSEIWDADGNLVERNLVEVENIRWMWELSKKHGTDVWATSCEQLWNNNIPDDIESYKWLKFGFHIEDDLLRNTILKELENKGCFEISNSSPVNIEVNALGINKAKGIKTVCDKLGLTMDEVMAVGDSLNDISMILEAGIGVAMGNAQEIVKEQADEVTTTNNEDGVANAIRKWALKEKSPIKK